MTCCFCYGGEGGGGAVSNCENGLKGRSLLRLLFNCGNAKRLQVAANFYTTAAVFIAFPVWLPNPRRTLLLIAAFFVIHRKKRISKRARWSKTSAVELQRGSRLFIPVTGAAPCLAECCRLRPWPAMCTPGWPERQHAGSLPPHACHHHGSDCQNCHGALSLLSWGQTSKMAVLGGRCLRN